MRQGELPLPSTGDPAPGDGVAGGAKRKFTAWFNSERRGPALRYSAGIDAFHQRNLRGDWVAKRETALLPEFQAYLRATDQTIPLNTLLQEAVSAPPHHGYRQKFQKESGR